MTREAAFYAELGQRIQRARKRRGLTQEKLAMSVGLTRTSMVNIERGRQKVLAHILVRLAHSLDEKIESLAQEPTNEVKIDELILGLSEADRKFVRSAITPTHLEGSRHATTKKTN